MGLDVSSATVALAVEADWNDTSIDTVIVSLFDRGQVICLLRWVTVFWSFIGNGDDNLGCVRVPLVVVLSWRVTWNVARCILPRQTSPVASRAPIFTGVSGIGIAVVNSTRQLANSTGIVTWELSESGCSRACVLVISCTVTGACCARECVSKTVDCFVNGHVCSFKHWLNALEISTRSKVSAVNYCADICPLGIHRTRCVDNEVQFDLATTGIVPGDLNVIVRIDNDVGVSFVPDNRCE